MIPFAAVAASRGGNLLNNEYGMNIQPVTYDNQQSVRLQGLEVDQMAEKDIMKGVESHIKKMLRGRRLNDSKKKKVHFNSEVLEAPTINQIDEPPILPIRQASIKSNIDEQPKAQEEKRRCWNTNNDN